MKLSKEAFNQYKDFLSDKVDEIYYEYLSSISKETSEKKIDSIAKSIISLEKDFFKSMNSQDEIKVDPMHYILMDCFFDYNVDYEC
jgi:hypothetical protein